MTERYSRSAIEGFGEEQQRRLSEARVFVAGCGGLGSAALQYMAAAGIGTLMIADHDRVALSNLQRQVLYTTDQIGMPKAECAAARLAAINPEIEIVAHTIAVDGDNFTRLAAEADMVVDCTDSYAVRVMLSEKCKAHGKPFIYASAEEMGGQVALFTPSCGVYYHELFAHMPAQKPPVGVLSPMPGIIGSIEAAEAIKYISSTGQTLEGRLLVADMRKLSFRIFDL